jgi:hypothetical protein
LACGFRAGRQDKKEEECSFLKKDPKNFYSFVYAAGEPRIYCQNSFASFLQKRRPFCLKPDYRRRKCTPYAQTILQPRLMNGQVE